MSADDKTVWTDARIREAFIDDGGQAEYYDPIDGAREQRRIAGEIFDTWLAARDAGRRVTTHDASCEADFGSEGQESPCRCAEREVIPSALVVDALTAFYGGERDLWSMNKVRRMRAALEAARTVR